MAYQQGGYQQGGYQQGGYQQGGNQRGQDNACSVFGNVLLFNIIRIIVIVI